MIRVLIVDDQALLRRGLRQLLELEEGLTVVGEASDGEQALTLVASIEVDVALVDARMPGMDGLTLIARLRDDHPGIATLLLTTFDDDELFFGGLAAGAGGFLLKDVEPDDLVRAIHSVRGRTLVVDPTLAPRLAARLSADRTGAAGVAGIAGVGAASPTEPLTERETEVAALVADGASNREIAAQLFMAEGTVKNHVSAALRKLGLRDRTQLALAMRGRG